MKTLQTLTVLAGILNDPLIQAYSQEDAISFLRKLYERGAEEGFAAYLANAVLTDANAFSRACAAGKNPSEFVRRAYLDDLKAISAVMEEEPHGFAYGETPSLLAGWNEAAMLRLKSYYAKNGCGIWLSHTAFRYNGTLQPILTPSEVTLSDLKGYESEKAEIEDNFDNFVRGLPYSDMLLYGDRGTGKSSTVKALLNEYAGQRLRMIEMPKEFLRQLPDLTGHLAAVPMKFIVFIDDLSFSDNDDSFAALKAVLEGGLASRPDNVVIYATSNRRHLLRESFSARQGDEVHHADTVQEAVSLSDRFGITLTFLMPDKQRFLEIVEQIAADRGLDVDRQTLLNAAERWALERGARSPRYARQFIADAQAKLSRGESL